MRKIKVGNENQKVFFTADSHFFHKNIIKYCFRPFKTFEEMNETIISNWNLVVAPKDIVFHLGDFMFHRERNTNKQIDATWKLLSRLNGLKHLIVGNHDGRGTCDCKAWVSVDDILQVKCFGETSIILCHYAMLVWKNSHHGYGHIFAHSHGTLGQSVDHHLGQNHVAEILKVRKMIDVGVDCWGFTPVSYHKVKEIMDEKDTGQVDHHKERTNG